MPKVRLVRIQIGRDDQPANRGVPTGGRGVCAVFLRQRARLEKVVRFDRVAVGNAAAVEDAAIGGRLEEGVAVGGIENKQTGAVVQIAGPAQFVDQRVGGRHGIVVGKNDRVGGQRAVIRRIIIQLGIVVGDQGRQFGLLAVDGRDLLLLRGRLAHRDDQRGDNRHD